METANNGAGHGLSWVRRLIVINLALVALQALSAGFLPFGSGLALTCQARVARAVAFGALTQAVATIALWRRRRVPGWIARVSVGLFVGVLLQIVAGHTKQYWLHVPIGVGLFGGLI